MKPVIANLILTSSIGLSSLLNASGIDKAQLAIPTFSDPTEILTLAGSLKLTLADQDGDRDLDMVLGRADGSLVYFQNDGNILNATFTETALASLDSIDAGNAAAPVFADLDKDGDEDLLIGAANGTVKYYKNTGDAYSPVFTEQTGSSNPFTNFSVGGNAAPAVGDIDYNGTLDVLIGAADGTVKYLKNTGSVVAPAFTELTGTDSFLTGVDFGDDAVPVLGDLDSDTDVDLVVGNQAGTFSVYHNGRGGYQGDSLTAVELPDVPSIGNYETGVKLVDTGWAAVHVDVNPFTGLDLGSAAAGCLVDLDADGDIDLVTADSSGAVQWLASGKVKKMVGIQGTHGVDGNPYTEDLGPYSGLGYSPHVHIEKGVLDPDATTHTFTDELFRSTLGSTEEMYENNWAPPGDASGRYRTFWYTRATGDLNGDGILDLVTLESSVLSDNETWKTSLSWKTADEWNLWGLENTAVSGWIEDYNDDIPEFIHGHVELADLDKDGDLDLIVGGNGSTGLNYLGYYENTGDATAPVFVRRTGDDNLVKDITFDAARSSAAPKFADLDGDGDLDCVLGIDFGLISYWENTSTDENVSFEEGAKMRLGDSSYRYYSQPMFGDFDKDGDLDLVVHEMARSHDVHPYVKVNYYEDLIKDHYFPSHYRFYKNNGSALNPNFKEVSSSFADWEPQEEAGNPVYKVYHRSRDTWPSYWDETSDTIETALRSTDGMDRFLIGDFNYDGNPDIHYMRQEVLYGQDCVWSYFYRTTEEESAPTATMAINYEAPYFTSEDLRIEVSFDEKVDRLNVDDFSVLNVDLNQVVSLSGATLSGSGKNYTLTLPGTNFVTGNFRVTLVAANSIAHDCFGNKVDADASFEVALTAITHDLSSRVAGTLTATHGDALSYTVTVRNESSTPAIGASLALRVSKWLSNAQVSSISVTGGATTSRSIGVINLTGYDTVNLPAGASIAYTLTGIADTVSPVGGRSENICTVSASVAGGGGFVDQNGFNDKGAFHTQVTARALPGGLFVDQGDLIGGATNNLYAVVHADLDGDGALDVILSNDNQFGYAKNGGAGAFFTSSVGGIGESMELGSPHYAVGDLDNDGDLDVVSPEEMIFGFGGVQLFINEGSDTFTPRTIGSHSSAHAYLRDMDNDGDLDVVLDTKVLWNDGAATFSTSTNFAADGITMGVADLNADGKNDLVRSNGILLQDERGAFSQIQSINVPSQTYEEVHIVDMDQDGDLDLVLAGWAETIYLNDGTGYFTDGEAFSSNYSSSEEWNNSPYIRSAMGDLNGDGYPDLVKVLKGTVDIGTGISSGTNTDYIFYGNGNGGFEDPVSFGDQWTHVDIADFNGDGRLDLAVGATWAREKNFRILLATTPAEITLLGDNPMSIESGIDFTTVDPGATATDVTDGNLTSSITVDASALVGLTSGTGEVLYSVVDSEGNTTTVAREVVIDAPPVADFVHSQYFNVQADSFQLDASNSYDLEDGNNLTYFWRPRNLSNAMTFDDNTSATPVMGNLYGIGYGPHYVRCYVTDSLGQTTMKEASFFVLKAPIADAGEDIVAEPNATVSLDASLSHDPDDPFNGTGIFYRWRQVSGPVSVSFADNRAKVTQATGVTQPGIYKFEFWIQDWNDLEATDQVTVTISSPPTASISNGGVVTYQGGPDTTLDGSSTGGTGAVSYLWEQIDAGPFATLSNETTATPTVEGLIDGESYTFQLTATDSFGRSSTDTVTLNLPLVHYSDSDVGEFETAHPTAWGDHDITGDSVGFDVVFDYTQEMLSNPTKYYLLYELSGQDSSASKLSVGIYGGSLLVGVTTSSGSSQTINAAHGLSSATAKVSVKLILENQTDEGLKVYVNGQSVKDQTIDLADAWAVAATSYLGSWHSTHSIALDYPEEAIYFAAYQLSGASKPDGNTEESFLAATWKPFAKAGDDVLTAAASITLDGSGSYDIDGSISSYQWSEIGGNTLTFTDASSAMTQVNGLTLGQVYTVQLQVTDNSGAIVTDTLTITAHALPVAAIANGNIGIANVGEVIAFDASTSNSPAGQSLSYLWEVDGSHPEINISDATSVTPSVSGFNAGESYTINLTVTDESGYSASSSVTINVPVAHYVAHGAGAMDQPNAKLWGGRDITSETAGISVVFDYTAELAAISNKYVPLYQVSEKGPLMLLYNQYLVLSTQKASGGGQTHFLEHGLTAPYDRASIQLVYNGSASTLTLYVNGTQAGEFTDPLANAWADSTTASVGIWSTSSSSIVDFPHDNIHFAAFQLSGANKPSGNTLGSFLVANWAPIAEAGEDIVTSDSSATLDARASYDVDSASLTYQWEFVGGNNTTLVGSNTATPTITNLDFDVTYSLQLTVTDAQGASATDTVTITRQKTAYEKWLSEQFPSDGNLIVDGEYDQDTLDRNRIAFVTDQDPSAAISENVIEFDVDDPIMFESSHKCRADAAFLNPVIEYSTDLNVWTEAEHGENGVIVTTDEGYYGQDAQGVNIDKINVSIPRSGKTQLFIRLKVD